MDLQPTLIVLAVAAACAVLFGWIGARPWDPRKGPRMAPYRFLMLLSATIAVFMAVHALSEAGITSGRP